MNTKAYLWMICNPELIPSYQVYKGDVFQMVNMAVDVILSRIYVSVGTRYITAQSPVNPEFFTFGYKVPGWLQINSTFNLLNNKDLN